jgi:hypothetical protein
MNGRMKLLFLLLTVIGWILQSGRYNTYKNYKLKQKISKEQY